MTQAPPLLLDGPAAPHARSFLDRWHEAVRTRDAARFADLLTDEVELHSPVYFKARKGRDEVAFLLGCVSRVFGPVEYLREWVSGGELALELATTVDDLQVKGIDLISLDDAGCIRRLEVMLRPPNAAARFRERMEREVVAALQARQQPR